MKWWDQMPMMILVFWMLSFKPIFSLSSFTFIKRLFSSSSLFAIRVVSSAYLRLLIFLPAILIPACASSSPAFLMMYSAYNLSKQGDNIQPWCTPFLIWNQSVVLCPVLTVASWPAHRFLKWQVRWSGILISFRIFQFVVILAIQGTLKSLLQHHSLRASILRCSVLFFFSALTSIHEDWKDHSLDDTDTCWQSDVFAF